MDNNEPSIAISATDHDTLVAGSNDYNTQNSDAWCGHYVTHDRGKTWKQGLVGGYPGGPINSLTGFHGAGDPVIVPDSTGGFYYAGIAFKRARNPINPIGFGINPGVDNCVFVARSTNNGDSFDQVVIVWAALESLVRFDDKEWVACDPNNPQNVYLVWVIFTAMLVARLMLSRSTDGGLSWSVPIAISETRAAEINLQGAAIVVDNSSAVHVTWIELFHARERRTHPAHPKPPAQLQLPHAGHDGAGGGHERDGHGRQPLCDLGRLRLRRRRRPSFVQP
jgi:hypothetical protein